MFINFGAAFNRVCCTTPFYAVAVVSERRHLYLAARDDNK